MKNFLKTLVIFIFLFVFSVLIPNNTDELQNDFQSLEATSSSISSILFDDIPFTLSQNNTRQELSQAKNENNNPINTFNKFNFAEKLLNQNHISAYLKKNKYNHSNIITSVLENAVYTRAP